MYKVEKDKIIIKIPVGNKGKFRFKERNGNIDFGDSFATREKEMNENVYLEWQIGYDVLIKDSLSGKKNTELTKKTFIGSNGKEKYLYELSEFLFFAIKIGILSKKDFLSAEKEIKKYKDFLDKNKIRVRKKDNVSINELKFQEASIELPTYFMLDTPDETIIEISIQKQQYATGVQPMVYFCIPITSFEKNTFVGNKSIPGDNLIYVFDKNNESVILQMCKVFGMASKRHQHDILEIFKVGCINMFV